MIKLNIDRDRYEVTQAVGDADAWYLFDQKEERVAAYICRTHENGIPGYDVEHSSTGMSHGLISSFTEAVELAVDVHEEALAFKEEA